MTDKAISPLRRRLIEDMTIRRLSPKTQYQYIRHVKKFARIFPFPWAWRTSLHRTHNGRSGSAAGTALDAPKRPLPDRGWFPR